VSLRALLESTPAGTRGVVDPIPCLTQDADLWFSDSPGEVEVAKRLCRDCPVRHDCLADAIERREAAGVWGGELFLAGVVVPFKRRPGRPPATAATRVAGHYADTVPLVPRRPCPAPSTTEVSS
jgi:WhiB family redox-sensing transcriptional regulator